MNQNQSSSASSDAHGDAILAQYYLDYEAGRPVDVDEILRCNPGLAPRLQAFLREQEQMQGMAAALKRPGSDTPTIRQSPKVAAEPVQMGMHFGDYELLGELARGGMGIVYRARQVSLNRIVALKLIRKDSESAEEVARFHQEAQTVAGLDHPNIVPVYEVGEHAGQHFFSMKLLEGGSLSAHLSDYARHPRALAIMLAQVARAVHFAHTRGILHRDLKPGNILMQGDPTEPLGWKPVVTDFGLAKHFQHDLEITRTGMIVGTPTYMSPEQAAGTKGLGPAADVYSLGAILYHALAGQPPFQTHSPIQTLLLLQAQDLDPPKITDRTVDRDLETIALKCLERKPSRRYESALALAEELERWSRQEPILARRSSLAERILRWSMRRPAWATLAYSTLLFATAGIAVFSYAWQAAQSHERIMEEYRKEKERSYERSFVERDCVLEEALAEQRRLREEVSKSRCQLHATRLNYAVDKVGESKLDSARTVLSECPTEDRGWEWTWIWNGMVRTTLPWKETRYVAATVSGFVAVDRKGVVRFSQTPDKKLFCTNRAPRAIGCPNPGQIVVVSEDGDVATFANERLSHFSVGPTNAACLAGSRLARWSPEGHLTVHGLESRALEHAWRQKIEGVDTLAWIEPSKLAVGLASSILIWSLETDVGIRLSSGARHVLRLDGLLATADKTTLRLMPPRADSPNWTIPVKNVQTLSALDGRRLVATTPSHVLWIDPKDGRIVWRVPNQGIRATCVSTDRRQFALVFDDRIELLTAEMP